MYEVDLATVETPVETNRSSLAHNSLARLVAGLGIGGFGFVTSLITARWLGPSGKGTLSALSFMGNILFFYLCALGLPEACLFLVGRREVDPDEALAGSLVPIGVALLFGFVGLAAAAAIAHWTKIIDAVVLEGAVLALAIYLQLFASLLNARERFWTTTRLTLARVGIGACATVVLVGLTDGGIAGAVLADCIGLVVASAGAILALRRVGVHFRLRPSLGFLRVAIRFGVLIQLGYLVMAMSQRADQLAVYSLAGTAKGGVYAVALTLGQVPAYAPGALSYASFPRMAQLDDEAAADLTAGVLRMGIALALIAGVVLAVVTPIATTTVFGASYAPSITPTMILLVGSVLWSAQWILARARAARGAPGLMLASFAVSVVVMLLLDLVLIPAAGVAGAACASVVGTALGLGVCLRTYRKRGFGLGFAELVPHAQDFRKLRYFVRSLVGRGR